MSKFKVFFHVTLLFLANGVVIIDIYTTNIKLETYDKIVESNFWIKYVANNMEDDMVCFIIAYIVCIVENWWQQQYDLKMDDAFFNKMKLLWQSLSVNQRKHTVATSQWLICANLTFEKAKQLNIPSKWLKYVNSYGENEGNDEKEDDTGIFVVCILLFVLNFVVGCGKQTDTIDGRSKLYLALSKTDFWQNEVLKHLNDPFVYHLIRYVIDEIQGVVNHHPPLKFDDDFYDMQIANWMFMPPPTQSYMRLFGQWRVGRLLIDIHAKILSIPLALFDINIDSWLNCMFTFHYILSYTLFIVI